MTRVGGRGWDGLEMGWGGGGGEGGLEAGFTGQVGSQLLHALQPGLIQHIFFIK